MFMPFEQDNTTNKVVIKNDLFTPDECNKIIKNAQKIKQQEAFIGGSTKNLNSKIRKNKIRWINNYDKNDLGWAFEKIAQFIYNANNDHYKFDLYGLTESLQFTEYTQKNDHYDWHSDSGLNQQIRKLSICIQLSDPKNYKGSKLKFHAYEYDKEFDKNFPINQGCAVIFPSYMEHQVTPLLSGKRYSWVTWIGGPNFK